MGISPAPQVAQDARALAGLDEAIFHQVVVGRLPISAGLIIGRVEDHQRQRELARLRAQLGWSDAILQEAAALARDAEILEQTGPQASFLPQIELADLQVNLAVRAAVRARLRSQIRALQAACQQTSRRWLKEAGWRGDPAEARTQRATAERMLRLFEKRANAGGPVTDYLDTLAGEVKAGSTPEKAVAAGWSLLSDVVWLEALA
ncbi:MAG: hypothetical protein WBN89_00585 [Prochlorococcaceae cyanobacterium]